MENKPRVKDITGRVAIVIDYFLSLSPSNWFTSPLDGVLFYSKEYPISNICQVFSLD